MTRNSSLLKAASFLLFSLPIVLLACSQDKDLPAAAKAPAAATPPAAPPAQATTETPSPVANTQDQVLLIVSKALRHNNLLTRPDPCYAYRLDPAPGQPAYAVDVMENHANPICGGDPQTQPHLFTVHVDKKTHALSHDAHAPGDFQPLAP